MIAPSDSETINILGATDDAYAPFYGIMLTSLFETNRREHFSVYMLFSSLNEDEVSKLESLVSKYGHSIQFITVDDRQLAKCPIRPDDHVTIATYYRLIAPAILPAELRKILWLDGDIIVNGPLTALWNTSLDGKAIGAVPDESHFNDEIYKRLELSRAIPYSSAGVLLINLEYWRENHITEKCLECIASVPDILLFHDQDTINIILEKEKFELPVTYNFQTGFILKWCFPNFSKKFQEEILSASSSPSIIHYTGPTKPWNKYNLHPYRVFFNYYKSKSPWRKLRLNGTTKDSFRNLIAMIARKTHLRSSSYLITDKQWS